MTASRMLGAARGIPEEDLLKIDHLHEVIENYIRKALEEDYWQDVVIVCLQDLEYELQYLWGFHQDKEFHTYWKQYLFRKAWYGRKFRCLSTGVEFTMPVDVRQGECYAVGEGFIDVGWHEAYYRIVGSIAEVL